MSSSGSARTTTRRGPRVLAAAAAVLLVVVAASAAALGHQSSATPTRSALSAAAGSPPGVLGREGRAAVDEADGVLPAGATVSDDLPGVADLDPALLGALRRAAAEAADVGVVFRVTSGWRSPEYQDQLLREAVSRYGSEEEAARWVATAETSAHVSGDAVDIGPADATAWLSEHGAEHGLCQVYANEPWHFELRPEAVDGQCPGMYDDPTQDPRMQP
jgi:zinc D-Ala-D-Ala carboxypeptidase